MPHDDVALARGEIEVLLGAGKREKRMPKPVQSMRRVRIVPIIEKVVVQQRTAQKRRAVDVHTGTGQDVGGRKTRPRDGQHMDVDRHVAVLDEVAREAQATRALELGSGTGDLAGTALDSIPGIPSAFHATPSTTDRFHICR